MTVIVSSFLLADFLSDISVNTGGLFCKRELQNLSGYTILEENDKNGGQTMAYTDDWENLMNGVFGAGGRSRNSFSSVRAVPVIPDFFAYLLKKFWKVIVARVLLSLLTFTCSFASMA